ncbi:Hypothetical predicted protein [Podarcis lilfordi]|uniref:Uncharacterized protein n=1 Tax=Podarcis lilfordi TaxID=74358 RepID=A0AA35NXL6_9SAUR|nr:Hypothetical predicted protein [Podarcis lilfordi]
MATSSYFPTQRKAKISSSENEALKITGSSNRFGGKLNGTPLEASPGAETRARPAPPPERDTEECSNPTHGWNGTPKDGSVTSQLQRPMRIKPHSLLSSSQLPWMLVGTQTQKSWRTIDATA